MTPTKLYPEYEFMEKSAKPDFVKCQFRCGEVFLHGSKEDLLYSKIDEHCRIYAKQF